MPSHFVACSEISIQRDLFIAMPLILYREQHLSTIGVILKLIKPPHDSYFLLYVIDRIDDACSGIGGIDAIYILVEPKGYCTSSEHSIS